MNTNSLELDQTEICEKYKSAVFFSDGVEKLGIALNSLRGSPIYGVRHSQENNHCGWYVWAGEHSDAVDFFSTMHVEHIHEVIPLIGIYLALAPGFKFIIDSEGYEDVWYEAS